MILVTVGTQKFQFNRLLETIDRLCDEGIIKDVVFAQIGNSDYHPKCFKYVDFLAKDEFDKKLNECDILITHSGVATIISGVMKEKAVVVFPRLAKYNEHVDNHQVQIAEEFATQNLVLACYQQSELEEIIHQSRTHVFNKYSSQRKRIINVINKFINTI